MEKLINNRNSVAAISSVLETIKFSLCAIDHPYVLLIMKHIGQSAYLEDFRNAHFIAIQNNTNGKLLQDCYGVTLALEILRPNPSAKVILCDSLPLKFARSRKPEVDLALTYENTHFLLVDHTLEQQQYENIFATPKKSTGIGSTYTHSIAAQHFISQIFHDLKYVKNLSYPTASEKPDAEKLIKKIQSFFPSLTESSPQEMITFLESVKEPRPLVMKGQILTGVYCDIEGTLLQDGELNHKVVSLLEKYTTEGKTVTLWTDGDIDDIKSRLDALGIAYPLKSKYDHAGAKAEIVIDDLDEYSFAALTMITAQRFIRVSELG